MKRNLIVTSAIVAFALSMAAVPADAQGRATRSGQGAGGGRQAPAASAPRNDGARQATGRQAVSRGSESRRGAGVQAQRSGEGRQPAAVREAPRSSEGRPSYGVPSQRSGEGRQPGAVQSVPRGYSGRQYEGAPGTSRGDEGRQVQGPRAVPRGGDARQPGDSRQYSGAPTAPRAGAGVRSPGYQSGDRRGYDQPRGGFDSRSYASRGGVVRYDGRRYARPRAYTPYRPHYFSRSYYAFRPRTNIGFGLWLGYSVRYPWSWYYGGYRPRLYGYWDGYVPGSVYYADRNVDYYGGLSFDIQPSDAELYIDGEFVGEVGLFTAYGEPLTLAPGWHRIAIVRDGYQTLEWDVEIEAGMVLPYHGVMEPW